MILKGSNISIAMGKTHGLDDIFWESHDPEGGLTIKFQSAWPLKIPLTPFNEFSIPKELMKSRGN